MSEYKPVERLNYSFYKWIHTSKDLSDLCYVGSTANITNRKRQHKSDCNNPNAKIYNNLLYTTMRENGGINNFKMVILGTAENITKREAQALEEEYRIKERTTLNSIRCYITDEQKKQEKVEYDQNHKEEIAKQKKEYNKNHKEEKAKYNKQYNQDHKKEKAEYAKQYTQDHRQEINEYHRQYRQKKKEKQLNEQKAKNTI